MYVVESTLALPKGVGESWVEKDLSTVSCIALAREYSEVYWVLTNQYLQGKHTLALTAVLEQVAGFTGTFNDWLASLGNKTLETTPGVPVLSNGTTSYRTAFHAGFGIQAFDHLKDPSEDLSPNEEIDLLLTRHDTDYAKMSRCVLATVNGLFHRTGVCEHGYVIYEGGRSANHCKGNMVGLLNFEHVSKFTTLTIDPEWIKKPIEDLPLADRLYLKLPESIYNKTVFLVVAGFLVPLGDSLRKVNDYTLSLSTNRLSLVNRYYLANDLIDLSSLSLGNLGADDSRRLLDEFRGDTFIKELLTLPQSFLIVFDHSGITMEREAIESLRVPGRWLVNKDPKGLLQVDFGYSPEYNVSAEPDGRYVLQSLPQYQKLLITQTKKLQASGETITSQSYGHDLLKLPVGHLTTFSSQSVEIKA